MAPDRRAQLTVLGIMAVASGACFYAAYLLPDGGFLGFVGVAPWVLGSMLAVRVPFRMWRFVRPDAAARWDANREAGRTPLAAPILFWLATAVLVWILLTGVEPEAEPTFADYAAMALLWCVAAGGAAFGIAFTLMYLRGRRGTAD